MLKYYIFRQIKGKYKEENNKGFTLLELLIVMLCATVLSLIAYPQVLSQVAKAREAEGIMILGSINRAQQAYRTEKAVFAQSLQDLSINLTVGKLNGNAYETNFYHYEIPETIQSDEVRHIAVPISNYEKMNKSLVSSVFANGYETYSVICKATKPLTQPEITDPQNCQNGEIIKR